LEVFNCEKTKKSKFVSDIYGKIKKMHDPSVCDPLALFPIFRPESVLSGMKVQMTVELSGLRTRGATKINWFDKNEKKYYCYLVKDINVAMLIKEIYESY